MRKLTILLAIAALWGAIADESAAEHGNRVAMRFARTMPWHGNHYHTAYGYPLGLVVPPTANMQTRMGWGVTQNEMVPIYHQFQRRYPRNGGEMPSRLFSPTPHWPSHTDQFGVYYVRGPW
jgi:hypothetical protein